MVLPGIDTGRDTELIREGYGDSLGNNRWRINGRIYTREGNVTLFPESGPGIVRLNRAEFNAMTVLVR